jgi:hypothetical protein
MSLGGGFYSRGSEEGSVAGFCECGNKYSVYMKGGEFTDHLNNC